MTFRLFLALACVATLAGASEPKLAYFADGFHGGVYGHYPPGYTGFLAGAIPALRQRLEVLLAAHDQPDDVLATQAEAARPTIKLDLDDAPDEAVGQTLGRYKLLERVGEGGCGVVYVAEQTEPVRRRVALKVIKLGMDTKQVVARFEAERQALAMMDHPNIAKVLDAGTTEVGRPYFVMELVRGIKITDYCDQANLTTKERLDLFIKVCQAIQHAHQKGIIHRDIKPSNILVTLHDGVPVPKVIDFGIAKATEGRLTDATVYTQLHQFIGTPAYMSPEQAEMSGLDIDTRSDIYAMGVLLYELLTGTTPFDPKELMKSGLDAMRKTIREKEPLRPSTRLNTLSGEELTTTAKRRGADVPRLIHLLRGDLDWIVMKCLEKDRTRRYETANGLAMDIQRHLSSEPVAACPPSRLYRVQKLMRRNKVAFAAGAAVFAALAAGFAVSTVLFVKEREARRRADEAERHAEAGREAEAKLRENAELRNKYVEVSHLLSAGQFAKAEQLFQEIPPRVESEPIYEALGNIHMSAKEWQAAITNFTRLVEFEPSNHIGFHYLAPILVQTGRTNEYQVLREQILRQFAGTSDPAVAERMAKDCLILPPPAADLPIISKMADTAVAAGTDHPSFAYFQFAKGFGEYRQGRFTDAVEWLRKVIDKKGDHEGAPYRTVQAYMVLSMAQWQLKQADDARATLTKGLHMAHDELPPEQVKSLGENANDWIISQILIREARALVEGSSNAGDKAK